MKETIYDVLARIIPKPIEAEPEPVPENSLAYLQSVYRNTLPPQSVRMRAAIAALGYEHAKLGVSLNVNVAGFGSRLERAIRARGLSPVIDARALPQPSDRGVADAERPGDTGERFAVP